ncbi:hypothetical protein [Pasteurella sp. PK-2025]|uniref:hypothetical protein n=1 Tax=Pasteurella sp. PK-2025 TaxID=3413133 RepID=UPI003C70EE63
MIIKYSGAKPFGPLGSDSKKSAQECFLKERENKREQFHLFEFHEFLKKKGMKELPRHFFYRFPEYSEMEMIGLEDGKLMYGTIMPGLEMMFNFLSSIKDEEMVIGEMRAMLDRIARKLDLMLKTP